MHTFLISVLSPLTEDSVHLSYFSSLILEGVCLLVSNACSAQAIWAIIPGRKEMFYLMTHSTHFIYSYMASESYLDAELEAIGLIQ